MNVIALVLAAAFIAIALFYYANKKRSIRRHNRRVDKLNRHQQLLEQLLQSKRGKDLEK